MGCRLLSESKGNFEEDSDDPDERDVDVSHANELVADTKQLQATVEVCAAASPAVVASRTQFPFV